MRIPFIKMHGLGNDFALLDTRADEFPAMTGAAIRQLANRRTGIGFDQLIVIEPSTAADVGMRIYNADGSEAEACGNASRAVALLLGQTATVATGGGLITVTPRGKTAQVEMGLPRFGWADIPLAYAMDTQAMPVAWEELQAPDAVNVGNPHVVFFVEDAATIDLARLGPVIETDALFPRKVNVNVASIGLGNTLNLRVWERGAGLTQACGTGACASAVAAVRRKLVTSPVTVRLPGGELSIAWSTGQGITMEGEACESYRGTIDWDHYA